MRKMEMIKIGTICIKTDTKTIEKKCAYEAVEIVEIVEQIFIFDISLINSQQIIYYL